MAEIKFAAMELVGAVEEDGGAFDTEIEIRKGDFGVFEMEVTLRSETALPTSDLPVR